MLKIWPRIAPIVMEIEPLAAGIAGVLLLVLIVIFAL